MNAESDSSNLSEPTRIRLLKLCNGFWYFVIIMAMVLLAIVWIRLELYAHSWVALGVYLGAPILLFVVAVGMLKLVAPVQRLNLSLLAASVVFLAFLIEIYLGFYGHVDLRSIKGLVSGVQVDPRSRKEVIEDLRNDGRRAYLTFHPLPFFLLEKSEKNGWNAIFSIENEEILL